MYRYREVIDYSTLCGLVCFTGKGSKASPELASLHAARSAMRPPGVRDHDNDPVDFRDVCIVPTPLELQCVEKVSYI